MKPINCVMCLCFINKFVLISPVLFEEDLVTDHESWHLLPEDCGINRPAKRIVGGRRAYMGQFPWMARLGYSRKENAEISFECGAGLISRWHVLTASHCITEEFVVVRIGEYNERTEEDCDFEYTCAPSVQDIEPLRILNHPEYDAATAFNDITLIWLTREVQFNDFVQPICLPRGIILRKDLTLKRAVVAGWGRVHPHRKIYSFDDLHYVSIVMRDRCACDQYYPFRDVLEGQICAGEANGEDSCTGDSGGPLVKGLIEKWQHRMYLIGLVSYGLPQCGEGPSVYTDVVYHMKWIMDSLQSANETLATQSEDFSTDETTTFEIETTFTENGAIDMPDICPKNFITEEEAPTELKTSSPCEIRYCDRSMENESENSGSEDRPHETAEESNENMSETDLDTDTGSQVKTVDYTVNVVDLISMIYTNRYYWAILKSTVVFILALKMARECNSLRIPMRDYRPFNRGFIRFVRIGDNFGRSPDCDNNVCAPPVQDIPVATIIMHPEYDDHTLLNDIALLKLTKPITYNEFVQPACMLNSTTKVTGMVEVAGWGYINNAGSIGTRLQYVTLPITSFNSCQNIYNVHARYARRKYCVGDFSGMDSCGGDSGGPMTKEFRTKQSRLNFVVGIVSYGLERCGHAPAIYTDIAYYRDWIYNNME